MMLAVFALLLHGSQATTPTCNACSSYEYMETAGESYYCQDSNNKCWNSVDCTGVGSLCQVASSCPDKKYTWIGASAGTDDWCNSNCNHNPSFCPVEDCSCSGTTPSDYCTKYTTNHHGQCDNDSKCKWWHGNGLSHCVASNICNPCSSYAFLQIGYPSYCQDSNNKCWSSADCTADDRLCTVGIPTTIPQCCASLCAVQPNTTDSSGGSSPAPSPSAPVVFQKNCTTDDDCGDDGNYCMNDETKTKPYVCHTTSVVMTFNVAIGNASRDLYNSASDTLNQHLGSDSRRGSDSRIVTLSNSVATASKVANMQLSKVTVLSKAQSYDEYCHDKTAAEGCVGDSSSSGLSTVAIVLIVLGCLLAVVAIVGGIWFYHSRRVGSGSLNESLLEDDGEDSYKRMPDIPNSQNTCHESAQTSIFDNP